MDTSEINMIFKDNMKTIHVLPQEQIKYVKTISFNVEYFGEYYSGKIVYKRNLSETYKMDETKRSDIDRCLCFYPEECYPCDIIDKIILKGVREKYPMAKVNTKLMLCDVELEDITRELSNYVKETFVIYIQPRIDDIDAILKSGKTEWRVFEKELPLYVTNTQDTELFKNASSFLYYSLDTENDLIDMESELLNEVTTF